jgi:hypothetical protein
LQTALGGSHGVSIGSGGHMRARIDTGSALRWPFLSAVGHCQSMMMPARPDEIEDQTEVTALDSREI